MKYNPEALRKIKVELRELRKIKKSLNAMMLHCEKCIEAATERQDVVLFKCMRLGLLAVHQGVDPKIVFRINTMDPKPGRARKTS